MKLDRKDRWTITYLILCVAMLLVSMTNVNGVSADHIGYYEDISSGWRRVVATDGAIIQYENTVPGIHCNNPAIAIKTGWAGFEVLQDGEVIFSYEDSEHVNGSNYVLVPLNSSSAGKNISIRSYDKEELLSRAIKYKSYYGDKYNIYRGIFRRNTLSIVLWVLYLNNVILIWISMIRYRKNVSIRSQFMFWYQSMFALAFGTWIIADSDFIGFILNAPRTATYLTYISLYLLPIFGLFFIDKLYAYENKNIKLCEGLFIFLGVVALALKILHIFEFYESIGYVIEFYAVFSTLFVLGPVKDMIVYQNRLIRRMLIGIPVLAICIVITAVSYLFKSSDHYAYALAFGVLIFMFFPYRETLRMAKDDANFERLVRDIQNKRNIDLDTGMRNSSAYEVEKKQIISDNGLVFVYVEIANYSHIRVEEGYLKSADLIRNTTESMLCAFKNTGTYYRLENGIFMLQMWKHSMDSVEEMLELFAKEIKEKCKNDDIELELYGGIARGKAGVSNEEILQEAKNNATLL